MHDRSYDRMGAVAAVVGGLLALVGNVLHPRYSDMDDVEIYTKIAESGIWKLDHLLLIVGILLVIAGTVAIARSLERDETVALARYGVLATVIGGAVALVSISLDAFAYRAAAETFVGASDQDRVSAFWAVNAIDKIGTGVFNMWTAVLLGVTPLLLGLAALRSRLYPSWLGLAATVGGVAGLCTGLVGMVIDDQDTLVIPFLVSSLLVTVWVIGAGWVMWQRAEARETVAP